MRIGGFQKMTAVDFPGRLACTVFIAGCDLRCPFCHNAQLVVPPVDDGLLMEEEEIFAYLEKRRDMLEGVCVTGGEPLIEKDIEAFLRRLRGLGYAVKLDTNGTLPQALARVLQQGLADYVAMDIKNCPARYAQTAGLSVFDTGLIEKSLNLLKESGIDFELRTTVVKELHTVQDIEALARWIAPYTSRYYLQSFIDSGHTIQKGLHACSPQELDQMLKAAQSWISGAQLRGIR